MISGVGQKVKLSCSASPLLLPANSGRYGAHATASVEAGYSALDEEHMERKTMMCVATHLYLADKYVFRAG